MMVEKFIVMHWLEKAATDKFLPPDRFGYGTSAQAYNTIEEAAKAAEALKKTVDPYISEGTAMVYEIKKIWFTE